MDDFGFGHELASALRGYRYQFIRKEVKVMKITTSFLAALLIVGGIGANRGFAAAEGVISNATLVPGSYCHLRFPAIRENTLSWDRPVLKDPTEGDIIDYYGSCNHDPLGQDEIASQRQQRSERLSNDYDD